MPEVTVTDVEVVLRVAQISFLDETKGTDNGQRSGVAAVQRVVTIAVPYQLALKAARQFQTFCERVAGIVARVAVTFEASFSVIRGAWIVKPARVVDVEVIAVSLAGVVTKIEVQSALPDGIRPLITPDYRRRLTPQQPTLGLLWVVSGQR